MGLPQPLELEPGWGRVQEQRGPEPVQQLPVQEREREPPLQQGRERLLLRPTKPKCLRLFHQ